MMKILITEPSNYSSEALSIYRKIGEELTLGISSVNELSALITDVEVLVLRLGFYIDKELLNKAEKLRYIVSPTTGLNHIDLEVCENKNIQIISLKGEVDFLSTITPTAELTWGLLLALVRKINSAFSSVLDGNWDRDTFLGMELFGKTLGIVGYGRLGKMVGKYADAFGMNVLYYDVQEVDEFGYENYASLDELLAKSDIISLHIPYDKSNILFFDESKFSRMKPDSYFVNTSRGELVCELSMLDALNNKRLAGAALDVLDNEISASADWLRGNALINYAKNNDNLLISPHIGGACPDSMCRTEVFCANKLMRLID